MPLLSLPFFLKMAIQAHRIPDLQPRTSHTAAKMRSREEPDVSHQYTLLRSLFNMPQQQQTRLYGSHGTSTTGRTSTAPAIGVQVVQDLEIDALIRLQSERMRSELEVVWKRQCRDLISVVGQQVVKIINEKDAEFEKASRRTAELQQKVRETAAEIQIWLGVAKDNEAVVCNLKSALDEALLQNAATASMSAELGSYDLAQQPADDAESCCYEGLDGGAAVLRNSEELRPRWACSVCREKEVCGLILPCRHLCLCKVCEPAIDTCPVCHTTTKASIQILLS